MRAWEVAMTPSLAGAKSQSRSVATASVRCLTPSPTVMATSASGPSADTFQSST